jgi:hypothetical protein
MGNYFKKQDVRTCSKVGNKEKIVTQLPVYENECGFKGYDPVSLMAETVKLRKLITKRGT